MPPVSQQPVKGSGSYPQERNWVWPADPQLGHPFPDAAPVVAANSSESRPQLTLERGRRGRERNDDDGTGG